MAPRAPEPWRDDPCRIGPEPANRTLLAAPGRALAAPGRAWLARLRTGSDRVSAGFGQFPGGSPENRRFPGKCSDLAPRAENLPRREGSLATPPGQVLARGAKFGHFSHLLGKHEIREKNRNSGIPRNGLGTPNACKADLRKWYRFANSYLRFRREKFGVTDPCFCSCVFQSL